MKKSTGKKAKVADTACDACDTQPKFTIASNHESDLNKTMLVIERAAISTSTNKILESRRSPKKTLSIINHMDYIQNTMPVVTSILVAGISLRGNLANRANEQLAILSKDYKRCAKELAELAADDRSLIKTPAISKLKRLLSHNDNIKSSATYVLAETGAIQPCEMHHFDSVNVGEEAYSNVTFFTFKNNTDLCIAAAVNSSYIPKAFETIKISELSSWLEKNSLKK